MLMWPILRRAALGFEGGCPALDAVPHDVRIVKAGDAPHAGKMPGPTRVSTVEWHALERWAYRTYVPASVQSRSGAGGDD